MRRLWTQEEETQLIHLMLETELTQEEIARQIGRPVRAVAVHWHDLRKKHGLPTRDQYLTQHRPLPSIEISKATIKDADLFAYLKDKPRSIEDLCRRFDCGPDRIKARLEAITEAGWVLQELADDRVSVQTESPPTIERTFPETLADRHGMVVPIACASDVHAGSIWCQPTALRAFTRIAYEQYGVRSIFNPGDSTEGIYGYRGINAELIPNAVPTERNHSRPASVLQAQLYDSYTPQMEGLTHYELGGNHDFWHIATNGFDPVRYVCNRRSDMVYLGYVAADIPLTDQVTIRLWHPARGNAYARSYPLQKGMESQAFADLQQAVAAEVSPKVSVIIAGHLHYTICNLQMPMVGVMAGTFQAKTKFMQGKALTPDLGGTILRFLLTDSGRIQRVEYSFIPFDPIPDDWKNYDVPVQAVEYEEPKVKMDALYRFVPSPDGEPFPISLDRGLQSDARPA